MTGAAMAMDESREGVDWHREGADVPNWALGAVAFLTIAVLAMVFGLVMGLQ